MIRSSNKMSCAGTSKNPASHQYRRSLAQQEEDQMVDYSIDRFECIKERGLTKKQVKNVLIARKLNIHHCYELALTKSPITWK